jgi:hypothetical protein
MARPTSVILPSLAFKQTQIETFPEGASLRCRYIRINQALAVYPWKRAKLYELTKRGAIKSFLLREPRNVGGIRLLDKDSIDTYLDRQAAAADKALAPLEATHEREAA